MEQSDDLGVVPREIELAALRAKEHRDLVEGPDGKWIYADTVVEVPGATSALLSEDVDSIALTPRGAETPTAFMIRRSEVEANQALAWVPKLGQLFSDDRDDEAFYRVVAEIWEEHSAVVTGVKAPEKDDRGMRQLLAVDERELRLNRRIGELLAERRARRVMIAAELGMPQKEISELLGISPGRVHQVIDDAGAAVKLEVADFVTDLVAVLRAVGTERIPRSDVRLPHDRGAEFVEELVRMGFLEEHEDTIEITEAGEQAEIHLRSKRKR